MAQILVTLRDDVDESALNEFITSWAKKGWKYIGPEYGFRQQKMHRFDAEGKREGIAFSGTRGKFKSVSVYYD